MATKTLTITEEAYNALKKEKGPEESFSETVLKVTSRKGKFSECAGVLKMSKGEWEKIRKTLDSSWATWKNDMPGL